MIKTKYIGALTWESIKPVGVDGAPQSVYRAQVLGGWLVETQSHRVGCGGLTFVPDPDHSWTLEPLKESDNDSPWLGA